MVTVNPPAKVIVTGASGFFASQLVSKLLSEGYLVIGTVRSSKKGDYLVNQFSNFDGNFTYVVVPDVEKEDAFDDIVKESTDVEAVFHTASPFHFAAKDPNEVIGPAVKGTIGILESIKKFGPSVKRVVVTSSTAAVGSPKTPPYTFSEKDWNDASPAAIERLGAEAHQGDKYRASKTLAEKAAWAFVQKNKEVINFELTTICPPFIFGPTIHQTSPSSLNESISGFRTVISTPIDNPQKAAAYNGCLVDVRDVAEAHVRAIQVEEAAGERFIVTAGPFCWQDIYDALRSAHIANIPEGFPGSQDPTKYLLQDGSKATRVLGIKYRDLKTIAVDTLQSLRGRFEGIC